MYHAMACLTVLKLLYLGEYSEVKADLATERERHAECHLTTGNRAEGTKLDFRYPICRSAIGQASCLICSRRRQLTFPFCG